GANPLDPVEWRQVDEAFAPQMALRDRLIGERPDDVLRLLPGAGDAAGELLDLVLSRLRGDTRYVPRPGILRRPDGVEVPLDRDRPLATLGRLLQADLCLMQQEEPGTEYRLTGAVLCFPAGWSLSEKIGMPMTRMHGPVPAFDAGITRRVHRLFEALRPDRPLWRMNVILRDDPALFVPLTEAEAAAQRGFWRGRAHLRSERQCLLRLPRTGAIVFSIHTYVVPVAALPADAVAALHASRDAKGH
ncbi:MAG: DUF3445 domain-containing protein, partial [Rhodobacteraceae bacterium]|nr:DUF3445 domain-containing protein [Paracoccaceae bacterium]